MVKNRGAIITLVLVFGSLFLLLLAGLLSFILLQMRQIEQKIAWQESFEIAEAGIDYVQWHLSQDPLNFNFEYGHGPYPYCSGAYFYDDCPSEKVIGNFTLNVTPPAGEKPTPDDPAIIESVGKILSFPKIERKIRIKYAEFPVSKYAVLNDGNIWFRKNEEITGQKIHANGGIRMDGEQSHLSTTSETTYICPSLHGCSSAECSSPCLWTAEGCQCPGIWGKGGGGVECEGDKCEVGTLSQGCLWKCGVEKVDFDEETKAIEPDPSLADLKKEAKDKGYYFGPSGKLGYHLYFQGDGKFKICIVKDKLLPKVEYYDPFKDQWFLDSHLPNEETEISCEIYSLSPNFLIFTEDHLWVEGDLNLRGTVVAAKPGGDPKDVIIADNIERVNLGASLGIIAQKDILIPLRVPVDLKIEASLLAKNGKLLRYRFPKYDWEPYKTHTIGKKLEVYGAVLTREEMAINWYSGEDLISGYQETKISSNPLAPPYFPTTGENQFINWEEI